MSLVSFDTFFEFNSYGTTRGHSLKLMKKRASTDTTFLRTSLDNKTVTSGSVDQLTSLKGFWKDSQKR